VHSIITMADLIAYIESDPDVGQYLDAMRAYRDQYGI
jgi:orotate phosphoribosyltransferase